LIDLLFAAAINIQGPSCEALVQGKPAWLGCSVNARIEALVLHGASNWAGQPVVSRVKIQLSNGINKVKVDQAMAAQWTIVGSSAANRIVFGGQAGAITKNFNSVIDMGKDDVKDVFTFTNSAPGKPFNHMQRFVVKNFGREDVIELKNIGKSFGYNDVQRDGSLLGGASVDSTRVQNLWRS
jgi:hypothetical protein